MDTNHYIQTLQNQYGFVMPNIQIDKIEEVEVREIPNGLRLFVDGESWMGINFIDYRQVYQLLSHYALAKGNVLCSGMGLLIRESLLLSKGVDITLVEINDKIIQYHKKHNSDILNKIEVVHKDIHDCVGTYDVVLFDHYEHETEEWIIEDVKSILKNIDCDVVWFYPLERICFKNGGWDFYNKLRQDIPKLPHLNIETLNTFIDNYFIDGKKYNIKKNERSEN